MNLILFIDDLIVISFFFSPAIARYMLPNYYFLDNKKTFVFTQLLIISFLGFIFFGGILESDIGIPRISIIYPLFLLVYNFIFYVKFQSFNHVLAISLVTVFLLNATFEVNLFVYEILYNDWPLANLLFGVLPMHPFMHIYTIIVGVWLFQLAEIKLSKYPAVLILLLLLIPFIPFYTSSIFTCSLEHHIIVSLAQFAIFAILILNWSGLKTVERTNYVSS